VTDHLLAVLLNYILSVM